MTYSEKLKDPRWQKKRLEIFQRDDFSCQLCKDKETTLHVHHRYYMGYYEPWDYPDSALVTLCAICHESEEQSKGSQKHLLHAFLDGGFFNNELVPLAELIRILISKAGKSSFDLLITRLALSDEFLEDVQKDLKEEMERLRNKKTHNDPDGLQF